MIKKIIQTILKKQGYKIVRIEPVLFLQNKVEYKVISPLEHNTKENMDRYFEDSDNLKKYVDGRQTFYRQLVEKIMKQKFDFKQKSKICDVGCGPGDLIYILSKSIHNSSAFYGLDHSDILVKIAATRFENINFKQFNLLDNDERFNNYFDIVICSEVIEHLINPKEAVNNLIKMTKEHGLLVLTVPEGRKDNYLGHINFWSPESWTQFIKEICKENNHLHFNIDLLEAGMNHYNLAVINIK